MKILILYIFSYNDNYNKMLELQNKYINSINNNNISNYFIVFREEQINPVEIENNFIYVKGKEAFLKITEKTLLSLNYLLNDLKLEFDFIIRTNISTIINFNNLINFLKSIPTTDIYCTGKLLVIKNIDLKSGIKNLSLYGLSYASGTSIILSFDVALFMTQNFDKFNHNIVDDVTISIFIRKYLPNAYKNLKLYIAPFIYMRSNTNLSKINNFVFIRNKNLQVKNNINNRENDFINMNNVINTLLLNE